jgi:poly(A) polymerase
VGGCVRDILLGSLPKDFDVATSATPEEVLALFPKAGRVGAHFGVVLVHQERAHVEVATFRADADYADGRRPSAVQLVRDPAEDASRRDFTINALFLDPETGEVLDFVEGRADLEAGLIRTVGEPAERFAEDHLRMLRAVRFAARFGFVIEPATLAAIQKHSAAIQRVSAERVQAELVRILVEGGARRGFEMLDESGLLQQLLPEVAAMKGVEQPPEYHPEGDVWVHTLEMLGRMRNPTVTLAMGVLLHDVGKPPAFLRAPDRIRFNGHVDMGLEIAAKILARLKFSAADTRQILALVGDHMKFMHVRQMKESTLKRFIRQDRFSEHLELHRLDCLSSHRRLESYEFVREKLNATPEEELTPPRLITGNDLIALGHTPGPRFREILDRVEEEQLEGALTTREQAVEWVKSNYPV